MSRSNHCPNRRLALAAIAALIAGCKTDSRKSVGTAGACPVRPTAALQPSNRLVVADATTLTSAELRTRLLDGLVGWAGAGDRFQVTHFGGTRAAWDGTARLIEVEGKGQVGDAERWRHAPNEIARMLACARATREDLRRALSAALGQQDDSPAGQSPIFESLMDLTQNWPGAAGSQRALVLISDGVQFSGNVAFLRSGRLTAPTPAELVRKLQRLDLVPQLSGMCVLHLCLGVGIARGPAATGGDLRTLKAAWMGYWAATGARLLALGTPLPLDGLPAVAVSTHP